MCLLHKAPGKKALRLHEGLPKPYDSILIGNIGRRANQVGMRASIISVTVSIHLHIVATAYARCQMLELAHVLYEVKSH